MCWHESIATVCLWMLYPANKSCIWWEPITWVSYFDETVTGCSVSPPAGVHHWYLLRPDLVRQATKVQQHHEGAASQQQHGGKDLDPWHFLPQLQKGWCSLDHHTQSHAADLEWWPHTLYSPVEDIKTMALLNFSFYYDFFANLQTKLVRKLVPVLM